MKNTKCTISIDGNITFCWTLWQMSDLWNNYKCYHRWVSDRVCECVCVCVQAVTIHNAQWRRVGWGTSEKCTGVSVGVFLVTVPAREDNANNLWGCEGVRVCVHACVHVCVHVTIRTFECVHIVNVLYDAENNLYKLLSKTTSTNCFRQHNSTEWFYFLQLPSSSYSSFPSLLPTVQSPVLN